MLTIEPASGTISRRLFLALALSLSTGQAACGRGAGSVARLEAAVDTVDGVERLMYPESGAPVLAWSLDTVARIGGYAAQSEAYQFGEVGPGALAGDGAGNLFVLDFMGKRVLGFDQEGSSIGIWGREGAGPGELQMPTGLGFGSDSIWVLDNGNQRITIFSRDPEGEPTSLPLPEGSGHMGGGIVPRDGGTYGVISMFSFRPGEDAGPPPRPLVFLGRDGTPGDTVWKSPPPVMDRLEIEMEGGGMMFMMAQRAFSPFLRWGLFSDGTFALTETAEYDVRLVRRDGAELLRIRRDPPPRPAAEADRQAERERMRESSVAGNFPGAEQMMEKRLEKLTFAEVIPRITGLAVDGSDRLWIGVSERTPGETDRIDVYDLDGQLLGEIRDLPFFPSLFYGNGLAAHLTRDDLDVQQVIVTRLVEE
jgi:hypothetical protein